MDYNFKLILIFWCFFSVSLRFSIAKNEETIDFGSFNLTVSGCSVEDFEGNENCTLSCNVLQTDLNHTFIYSDARWTYYTTDPSINVTFFYRGDQYQTENEHVTSNGQVFNVTEYTMTFTVSEMDYHPGNYRCYFALEGDEYAITEIFYDFNISDSASFESLMGEPCEVNSDCMAVDSTCSPIDSVCTCSMPFNIPKTNTPENPACLQPMIIFGHCNVQEQCNADQRMICRGERCVCNGWFADIPELSEDHPSCIEISPLFSACQYNESCEFFSNISQCVENRCECRDNASMGTNLLSCTETPLIIETFVNSEELTCVVTNNDPQLKFHHYLWTYKIASGLAVNITLFESTLTQMEAEVTSTYPLTTYSAGLYFCQFYFADVDGNLTEMNRAFNLSEIAGVLIDEPCETSSNCAALHAQCVLTNVTLPDNETVDEMLCECRGDYDIQYWLYPNAPACLNHVPENGSCNTDEQCTQLHQSLYCQNQICSCTGEHAQVAQENDKMMCLIPAPLTAKCDYVEQCLLITSNSACIDSACDCKDGYEMDDSKTFCEANLSGGAIAGIVIGSVAGAAVILSLIVYAVKR